MLYSADNFYYEAISFWLRVRQAYLTCASYVFFKICDMSVGCFHVSFALYMQHSI